MSDRMNQALTTAEKAAAGVTQLAHLGRVRWTICAMLFAATSINYMDRQVIGLLKPTLQNAIGLTEVNYGYIVAAFQVAYAAGLVVAGRLVDRLGTRIGYSLFMGMWSLAAASASLAAVSDTHLAQTNAALDDLASRRADLANQMRAALEGAAFSGQRVDPAQVTDLEARAQVLIDSAQVLSQGNP